MGFCRIRAERAALGLAALTCCAAAGPRAPDLVVEGLTDPSPLGSLLRTEGRRACEDARAWFGTEVEGPVTIAWAAGPDRLVELAGGDPGPVAGLAIARRGLVVLHAPALQSRPHRIVNVLRHEICHLYFAAATAGAEVEPPRWLNEGVAMHWSGEWDLGLDYRRDQVSLLRDATAAGTLLSFRDLDASFPSGPFFHVAYAQSQSFVDWLVRRGGEESLQRFIARLNADEDPDVAFRHAYGVEMSRAEEEWRKAIGGGRLGRIPSATVLINAAWGLLGLLVIIRFVMVRYRLRRVAEDPMEPRWPEPPRRHGAVGSTGGVGRTPDSEPPESAP